jgi:hypothetical protein
MVFRISFLLVILSVLLMFCPIKPAIADVGIGLFSSALTVLLIELSIIERDKKKLGYLRGSYKRTEIKNRLDFRDAKTDTRYEDITTKYSNVDPVIDLDYMGAGKYSGLIHYNEGDAVFNFMLDSTNPSVGKGVYQYIIKKENYKMPDFGVFEVFVDAKDNNILRVFHENRIPSGIEGGYEIWIKT